MTRPNDPDVNGTSRRSAHQSEPAGKECGVPLAAALHQGQRTHRSPGVAKDKAVQLPDGATLSEAVLAERESRDY